MPSTTAAAIPILASTLLEQEREKSEATASRGAVWKTGVKSVDEEFPLGFWSGGGLIGVGDAEGEEGGKLVLHIIATHLLSFLPQPLSGPSDYRGRPGPAAYPPQRAGSPTNLESRKDTNNTNTDTTTLAEEALPTSTYIITPPPPTSSILTPQNILSTLQNLHQNRGPSSSTGSREPLTGLLSSVFLLQYFDFPGLLESVSEVSDSLYHNKSQKQSEKTRRKSLVVINALDTTVQFLKQSRTSSTGLLHTNALLSSLMRQLNQLATQYPDALLLVCTVPRVGTAASSGSGSQSGSISVSGTAAGSSQTISAFAGSNVLGLTCLTPTVDGGNNTTSTTRDPRDSSRAPNESMRPTSLSHSRSAASQHSYRISTSQILEQGVRKWVLVHRPLLSAEKKKSGQNQRLGQGQRWDEDTTITRVVEVVKDDAFGFQFVAGVEDGADVGLGIGKSIGDDGRSSAARGGAGGGGAEGKRTGLGNVDGNGLGCWAVWKSRF